MKKRLRRLARVLVVVSVVILFALLLLGGVLWMGDAPAMNGLVLYVIIVLLSLMYWIGGKLGETDS